ncbi:RHS repeat-associated core domain-containing protein [Pseudomonas graminis]|uniref:RHS repeat-associated core domain-containing protein n=1 Tax=Pseudomonas graminis TaxID=158627 RepID=UPI002349610F|nr:RHS repeat-associated core domain-containing protein [Pseudomonas graminis]MDC6380715.1 RHS repeat-associated core domain-containing protein [Pseudomonas graminis]
MPLSDPLSPDPGVGRFISNDPISYAGGLNLHVYAPNPISWIDPTGLASSGRWEPVGTGRIRLDPRHVENTNQQVHAHYQCKSRKKEIVVSRDGSRSDVDDLTRK